MSSPTAVRDEEQQSSAAATREEAAVVVVDPDVATTSTQLMPIKGILKRASSHSNFPREGVVEQNATTENQQQPRQFRQSSDRFSDRPTTKIPKLTLTWSEKNAVAIYGDTTSDEATTETDDAQVPAIAPFSTSQQTRIPLPPPPPPPPPSSVPSSSVNARYAAERQTAILHDDYDYEEGEETATSKQNATQFVDGDADEPPSEAEKEDERSGNEQQQSSSSVAAAAAVATTIGSSHIAGKWWFGKSTKNIPHCAKWGCTHGHHGSECTDDGGEYLTPTQRRSREIHHLRKQLKLAFAQLEDKDSHLNELRERLQDLESMIGSTSTLSEQHQLMLRHKEFVENYEREKQKLIDKHEIRVRQLIQEAVDARAEMMKVKVALKQLEETKVDVKDKETMTERIETTPEAPVHPEPPRMSSSFPPSPQVERVVQPSLPQIPKELLLQLQAYENEAMVWRTKAAQLEIVLKEQILKSQQGISPELERCRSEIERLRMHIKNMETNGSNRAMVDSGIETNLNIISPTMTECYSPQCSERKKQLVEENNRLLEKIEEQTMRLNDYEDDLTLLRNTVHSMEDENKKNFLAMEQMSKEIEERTAEVQAANMAVVRLQGEVATKTKAICYLEERHQMYRNVILENHLVVKDESTEDWRRGFSDPRYVVNVSKRTQTDLTEEALRKNEVHFISLTDKLKEMEEELSSRKSDMLGRFQEIEKDLLIKSSLVDSLTHQLEEADREAARSSELHQQQRDALQERLRELGQIAEKVPIMQFEIEKLQQERGLLEYQLKNAKEEYDAGLEVALTESLKKFREQSNYWTDKIAAINANNESLRNENIALKRSMDELKLRTQMEKADMANRLTSSIDHVSYLKKQLNRRTRDVQVDVHPRVVSKYVACRPNARHKMTDIEKGDLFDEVEERLKLCQGELNTTRRQVEVLQQKLVDTVVQTQVEDRLIYEKFAPIKLLAPSKELSVVSTATTDSISKETDDASSILESLKDQVQELRNRNRELSAQIHSSESEKQSLISAQREQISHLVTEFDVVRKELDQELGRYENERQRMKARIAVLEKVQTERDELLERLKNTAVINEKSGQPIGSTASKTSALLVHRTSIDEEGDEEKCMDQKSRIKRWMSVPHLFDKSAVVVAPVAVTSNEIATLHERNSVLARDNARLNRELLALRHSIESSIRRTSQMSYGITGSAANSTTNTSFQKNLSASTEDHFDIAADLTQVREDLENIITQIDSSVNRTDVKSKRNHLCTSPSGRNRSSSPQSITTELEQLKHALKRSEEECEALNEQLDRITQDFQDACRELDLYKREPRQDALKYSRDIRLSRSRSYVEIGRATIDLDEHFRWKEKAGTLFREVNRIRKEYRACDTERRELRLQLVMLRGELGLAQCQLAEMLASQRRKQCGSIPNVLAATTISTSPTLSERKRLKNLKLRGKLSEDFRDVLDHSPSATTYATACTSLWSLNDAYFSASEPELAASRFEGVREYRSPIRSRGGSNRSAAAAAASSHESRKSSVRDEEMRRSLQEHDVIIKEAAKLQIASLRREVEHLQKDISGRKATEEEEKLREKLAELNKTNESLQAELYSRSLALDSLRQYSDSRFLTYEEQSTKDKQKLEGLEKQIGELRREQKRRVEEAATYESRIVMLSRENKMFVKKIDEMEKERQDMYLVMFKKGQEAAERDVQETKSVDEMTEDRIVLRFLHDAFYYYLLNKGDSREHLQAIMTMLNFSSQQKEDVYRKRGSSH